MCMLHDGFVPKEIGFAAGSYNKIIIRVSGFRSLQLFAFGKDPDRFFQPDLDIFRALEHFPEWKRNIGRLKPCCCYLIKQRLELVMILLVDQENIKKRIVKLPGYLQSGEAAAQNDDLLFLHKE